MATKMKATPKKQPVRIEIGSNATFLFILIACMLFVLAFIKFILTSKP